MGSAALPHSGKASPFPNLHRTLRLSPETPLPTMALGLTSWQVAWSETEHIIACAAYGTSNPVMLCFYDPQLGEVEMSSAKQQKLLTG